MIFARATALVLGLAAQFGALAWLREPGYPVIVALLLHVSGAVAAGWGATLWPPLAAPRAWWLLAGWSTVFPVGGFFAGILCAGLLRRPPPPQVEPPYLVWKDQPQSQWSAHLPTGAANLSIVQILQSPRTQLRRNAVLALRDLDAQLAIPLLRRGLQDSDEQVRIYAQNILSAMLERFEAGIKEQQRRLASSPEAVAPAVNLAEQYFELVYLDVAGDEETAAHYLGQTLALLERAHHAEPANGRIAFLGLKYALRARDLAGAQRWFTRAAQGTVEPQQLLPWRMELLFLQRDWAALQQLCAEFLRAGHVNDRIERLAAFWLGRTPARP